MDIIDSLARQAMEAFDLAIRIPHSGENGRAREQAIRDFLERIVPPRFGVDTGFVIDGRGGVSKQIDIVIHEFGRFPILHVGGIQFFMVESVAAVIECKADISSTAYLREALENIASVKRLDRTNGGINQVWPTLRPVYPNDVRDQIWGGVFGGQSLTTEMCLRGIDDWLAQNPRETWINSYTDARSFALFYMESIDGTPKSTPDLMIAEGLAAGTGVDDAGHSVSPLTSMCVKLLSHLRLVPQIAFQDRGYFVDMMIPVGEGHISFDYDGSDNQ